MLTGSADGEVIYWDLVEQKARFTLNAHQNFVRGVTFSNNKALSADTVFVSCGDDKKINIWSLNYIKE